MTATQPKSAFLQAKVDHFSADRQKGKSQKDLDRMFFHHKQVVKKIPNPLDRDIFGQHAEEDDHRFRYDWMSLFNRPGYIRKLRKVAENFNFHNENIKQHQCFDVVRPYETDRGFISKRRQPNFHDDQFPANLYSSGRRSTHYGIKWSKFSDYAKSSCLGKYIDPNDIRIGVLSSPEFVSVLASLAQRQSNIKKLIQNQQILADGFYYVRIHVNSVWRYISVDDSIPLVDQNPACSCSFPDNQCDLWVALIEKAYTKSFGGTYDFFNRMVPRENILRDLTGAPVQIYKLDNPDIGKIIKTAVDKGHVVQAVGNQQLAKLGLNPNFSYTVTGYSNKGIQMRNSWGTLEEKSNVKCNKEGLFQLPAAQCLKTLEHILISRVEDKYYTSTIESKHKNGFFSTFTFALQNYTHGYLSVSQIDERLLTKKAQYKYSPMRFILEKKSAGSITFIKGVYTRDSRNTDVQVDLTPGQYFVHVIGDWVGQQYDFFLSFYAENPVIFKKHYSREFPHILTQSLEREAIDNGTMTTKKEVNEYILYQQSTNLLIITAQNADNKPEKHVHDLTRVKFDTLKLLNAQNKKENFKHKTAQQLQEYKAQLQKSKKWQVDLRPGQTMTWVLSVHEPYRSDSIRRWNL